MREMGQTATQEAPKQGSDDIEAAIVRMGFGVANRAEARKTIRGFQEKARNGNIPAQEYLRKYGISW
jgi:hypothetical protein